ncbi:FKBP-type peptidyl-prolyl cis-trans isomerase [Aurantiacibacter aquimixticola]|uniref:Peptidyl-prolyl cis-trans isomerase n=1 Tax=Aurantiacibacter aquimixticola TaxID=1958945 RepID=A0A419RTF4_9SPHN|nr:FKBP-type peptidyl-prolyl cis-trans isomerase [Aurantiacibacter aquimixticola]RJY09068.1 peptidylprolyl isomerase [Aurantiacibacter aquimixticola]
MAEVTRVPLRPIAKGSLFKLWIGVIVAVLIAGAVAWAAVPEGVDVDTIREGEGPNPTPESVVFVEYIGKLDDGTEFDRSPPTLPLPPEIADMVPTGIPMELQNVVPGFRDGLLQTQQGGAYTIEIPGSLAYGDAPPPGSDIPPNADLTFEVTVHEIMSQEEFQGLAQRIQMLMLQQQMETQGQGDGEAAPQVQGPPQ